MMASRTPAHEIDGITHPREQDGWHHPPPCVHGSDGIVRAYGCDGSVTRRTASRIPVRGDDRIVRTGPALSRQRSCAAHPITRSRQLCGPPYPVRGHAEGAGRRPRCRKICIGPGPKRPGRWRPGGRRGGEGGGFTRAGPNADFPRPQADAAKRPRRGPESEPRLRLTGRHGDDPAGA